MWQWRLAGRRGCVAVAGGAWSKHDCPTQGNKEPGATHTLVTADENVVHVQAREPPSMAPHPGWWC